MHPIADIMHMVHYFFAQHMTITSIAQLFKTARDGRSQAEFALELGVSQSSLCRYEQGCANPKAEVIERCMRLVHWSDHDSGPTVEDLVNKVRTQLSREDQALLREALSKLIDGLLAGKDMSHTMSKQSGYDRG